jgi:hypothetical protein
MTAIRKVMGLAGVAACLSLGGCAQLMPRFAIGDSPQACMSGYSPAAPWHMDHGGGVFVARNRVAAVQSRFMLGSSPASMRPMRGTALAAGECR